MLSDPRLQEVLLFNKKGVGVSFVDANRSTENDQQIHGFRARRPEIAYTEVAVVDLVAGIHQYGFESSEVFKMNVPYGNRCVHLRFNRAGERMVTSPSAYRLTTLGQ